MKLRICLILSLLLFCLLLPGSIFAAENLSFVHQDHLGSTILITDSTGKLISKQVYYPFGETRNEVSEVGYQVTNRQYTGQVSDQDETGLYYYNARYYNPAIAKFTQADTANDQRNRYAYVANNPIRLVDPSGNVICGTENNPCPSSTFGNASNYTDEAKNPTTLIGFFKNLAAETLNVVGLLDLTPQSWGLMDYVSQESYLEGQAGLMIPGPMPMSVVSLGSLTAKQGIMAKTFRDVEKGVVSKVFKPIGVEYSMFQRRMYRTFSGKVPWIKYEGRIAEEFGEGFAQRYYPGISLKDFIESGGEFSSGEIRRAVNNLNTIHDVTLTAHGDLAHWRTSSGLLEAKGNLGNFWVNNPSSSMSRAIMAVDFWGAPNQSSLYRNLALTHSKVLDEELTAFEALLRTFQR